MWNNLVELSKGFIGGFAAGVVTPWIVKNFGYQIYQFVKPYWLKLFNKATPPVVNG